MHHGEVVGYEGHLAIYIGCCKCHCKFIDVSTDTGEVTCVREGYGKKEIHKYHYPSSLLERR